MNCRDFLGGLIKVFEKEGILYEPDEDDYPRIRGKKICEFELADIRNDN